MASIPKRVSERISSRLKTFQGIITSARDRDVNESDTVTILVDVLSDLLGYDKYSEITREYSIRGQYCDLALKVEGKVYCLIEAKAIGLPLKEQHVMQAVIYGAREGIEWVVLTNGVTWRIYRISFGQPINQELVAEFDMLQLSARSDKDADMLYLISREGIVRSALHAFDAQRKATDKFAIAAVLVSDPILKAIRRELRSLNDGVAIDVEEIKSALELDVIKREIVDGQRGEEARKRLAKAAKKREKDGAQPTKSMGSVVPAPMGGTSESDIPKS